MYTALVDETKKFFSQVVELHDAKFSVGRSLQSDLVIEDIQISRTHCELELRDNAWYIYDKSSNGTKVNGISLGKRDFVRLKDGDRIDLSDAVTFLFVRRENLDKSSNVDSRQPVMNESTLPTCPESKVEPAAAESIPIPERSEPSSQDKKRRAVSEDDINSKKAKTENVEEELVCSVCSELFVKATTLTCSHSYCKYCITEWKKGHVFCPICRAPITAMHPTIVIDNMVAKVIESADEETKNLRQQLLQERERLDAENTVEVCPSNSSAVEVRSSSDDETYWNYSSAGEEEESDYDSDYDDDIVFDFTFKTSRYGGYGNCYTCGEPGHWSPACPRRRWR